jgi:hypothetical protein
MKFFTPDMLILLNSPDDAVSGSAMDAWEVAAAAYETHLTKLAQEMPAGVRILADLNLHDGEILTWGRPGGRARPNGSVGVGGSGKQSVVAIRLDDVFTSITYDLTAAVRSSSRRTTKPFQARDHVDWLYDELDVGPAGRGTYLHRVMLSDGRVVEVPFSSVVVQQFPLSPPSSDRIAPAKPQVRRSA